MSKSSSLASNTTAATSPTASSIAMSRSLSLSSAPTSLAEALALEGFKHVDICQCKGIAQVLEAINSQSDKLMAGVSNQQYLVFSSVTQTDLAKIDSIHGRHTRVTYYEDINLLIITLVTVETEAVHVNFGRMITAKITSMGMSEDGLFGLGGARFIGSSCSKEGDTCFKPCSRNHKGDLPTIVIEAGLSESLAKLRCDANWWLEHPGRNGGKVMIVLIFLIKPKDKSLRIEKWQNSPAPARPITRANPGPPNLNPIPTSIQQITITPNRVTGAPLVLHFENIFLRQPIAPETDITFTANELAAFETYFWNGVKS
jgi:hypothetical protein